MRACSGPRFFRHFYSLSRLRPNIYLGGSSLYCHVSDTVSLPPIVAPQKARACRLVRAATDQFGGTGMELVPSVSVPHRPQQTRRSVARGPDLVTVRGGPEDRQMAYLGYLS